MLSVIENRRDIDQVESALQRLFQRECGAEYSCFLTNPEGQFSVRVCWFPHHRFWTSLKVAGENRYWSAFGWAGREKENPSELYARSTRQLAEQRKRPLQLDKEGYLLGLRIDPELEWRLRWERLELPVDLLVHDASWGQLQLEMTYIPPDMTVEFQAKLRAAKAREKGLSAPPTVTSLL